MLSWFWDTWWSKTTESLASIKQDTTRILKEVSEQKITNEELKAFSEQIRQAAARVPSVK